MSENNNEKASTGNWAHLAGQDWSYLLQYQPRFADKCDMSKFTGSHIVRLFRERGRRPATGLYARVGECDLSTLTASNWCGILALRPDLADKFEASTRDWSADEPKVSDEDAALDESEVVSADEFFREA